jgi:hypothetical protein
MYMYVYDRHSSVDISSLDGHVYLLNTTYTPQRYAIIINKYQTVT